MYKGLRLFLLSLLLPAFMASATGMQITKHVCEQCHLVEFSLDGTGSGNCCPTVHVADAVSCCSTPEESAAVPSSCESEQGSPALPAPGAMHLPDEGPGLQSTCCHQISQYLISDTTISTTSLLLIFFKTPLSGKVNPLVLPEDGPFFAFQQKNFLWKDTGRSLLLSIHQLKLDCQV